MYHRQVDSLGMFTFLYNGEIELDILFRSLPLINQYTNQLASYLFLQPPGWFLPSNTACSILPGWLLTLALPTAGSFHQRFIRDLLQWHCFPEVFPTAQPLQRVLLCSFQIAHSTLWTQTVWHCRSCRFVFISPFLLCSQPRLQQQRSIWLSNYWLNKCPKNKGVTSVSFRLFTCAMTSYLAVFVVFQNLWVCFFWSIGFFF